MIKWLKAKKGISLLEIMLATVIASICLYAVVDLFYLNIQTSNLRFAELNKSSELNSFYLIKNSLKEGHLNKNGQTVIGNSISPQQIVYSTTYFSNGNTNEMYSLKCNASNNGTGNIIGKKNSEPEKVLVNNVSTCKFTYYKGNGEIAANAAQTRIVALDAEYYIGKEKKTIRIYEKLMQES